MWQFCGSIKFICSECGSASEVSISDFEIDTYGSDERSMGTELLYDLRCEFNCANCNNSILLHFDVSEYPVEVINFIRNISTGADVLSEPDTEYIEELYSYSDNEFEQLSNPIQELIIYLRNNPEYMREITPRDFEEVIAEIFKDKGFVVDLTMRTRDGGKDIIAIHKNELGIETKFFIECKRYAENNKVGVDVIRALHGVKNTLNGPNKTILVTTSSFTPDARNFVANELTSTWDMSLIDYQGIVSWLQNYGDSDPDDYI